jgi:hypothetical protein
MAKFTTFFPTHVSPQLSCFIAFKYLYNRTYHLILSCLYIPQDHLTGSSLVPKRALQGLVSYTRKCDRKIETGVDDRNERQIC